MVLGVGLAQKHLAHRPLEPLRHRHSGLIKCLHINVGREAELLNDGQDAVLDLSAGPYRDDCILP